LKVVEAMKRSHVFCFPTEASEGFPKVVLEALACGLPVVTTRVSVLPHLIGEECGILLGKPTEENLAEAVKVIFSDAKKYELMSAAAVAKAQQYSLENWRESIGETLRRSWKVDSLSSLEDHEGF
ncbi:MAG: glycosyltransferase family 4 protein, partial [Acidobacteria bacterium]|nr:glycosyltransferase family 4 protein [Acidobacteriota bacterium]